MSSSLSTLLRACALAAAATSSVTALSGCALTSPAVAPSVDIPKRWGEVESSTATDTNVQAPTHTTDAWWKAFGSSDLDTLVERALQANRDLQIASSRVAQARAVTNAADAALLPELNLNAGIAHGRQSATDPKANQQSIGLGAHWEPDLFGAESLAARAASSDAKAAELVRRATELTVAADVTTAWLEAAALGRRIAVNETVISTLEHEIDVTRRRFDAGLATDVDLDRLTTDLGGAKADAAQLHGAREVRLQQLAVLTGSARPIAPPSFDKLDSPADSNPPALLPAELLERRPDVLAQARAVDAAVARLGVARRDLYPHIELDWSASHQHLAIQGAGASNVLVLGYGVSLSLPIFDGGRIRANIDIHEGQTQEAMKAYEKAMLNAIADAQIALAQQASAAQAGAALEQAAHAATEAEHKVGRMFDAGLADLSTVLDTQRASLKAQDALVQGWASQWTAVVSVRRAFAGAV